MRKKFFHESSTAKESHWCWKLLKKQTTEFCLSTGLHGYKYIGQSQRSGIERAIWAAAVFSSIICAIILMKMAYDYYTLHSIFTVIESTHHGIWNYPFPAVTICNINRVSKKLSKRLIENLKIPSTISKDFLADQMKLMLEFLDPGAYEGDISKNLTVLQDVFDYNNLSITDVIYSTTQNCSDLIHKCKWNGKIVQCTSLFDPSFSRDGLCCSFNYMTLNSTTNLLSIQRMRRISACGYQTGLIVFLNLDSEDYFATILGSVGAKVMIHYPLDYPDYNAENKYTTIGTQSFLSITPQETYSTEKVNYLPISTRKCVFSHEGILTRRNVGNELRRNLAIENYTYLNCLAECRASVIRQKCQCIPYYYPQNGVRICNLKDIRCLIKYKHLYDTSWPIINNASHTKFGIIDSLERPCGCIPDCNLYRYPLESSQGTLSKNIYYTNDSFTRDSNTGFNIFNYSIVHIFFGDLVSIQYRRNVQYDWRNLFASFGGLLGLFSGFSLMSGFELIYFFIIRLIIDALSKKRQKPVEKENNCSVIEIS
ncbi:sodium channel protein Nach-like [Prorops nasuta]|uniref:sodium channel protein Nach-like n=1 Tax=Prorops nasuta TaxID=863751 RepID=UPI0034CEE574